MCTLTWIKHPYHYDIFFNRDEQRSRPEAIAPIFHSKSQSIHPIDPQGGGTWIGVHQTGLSLALLNNYQAAQEFQPSGKPLSRGIIIPHIFEYNSESLNQATSQTDLNKLLQEAISGFKLDNMSPFHLVLFHNRFEPLQITWNGLQIKTASARQPVTSSSFQFLEVSQQRIQLFNPSMKTLEYHKEFHGSHTPEPCAYSVCMHRSDAKTVSFTHIDTSAKVLNYWPQSPCRLNSEEMHQTTF